MSIPSDPAVASALVQDPSTKADVLAELAASPLAFLKEGVAVHPNVTADILDALVEKNLDPATDLGLALARAVASNARTRSTTLGKLLALLDAKKVDGSQRQNWPFEDLAERILTHRSCPEHEGIAFLMRAKMPREIRARIARHTANREILTVLASESSTVVKGATARNVRAPNDIN